MCLGKDTVNGILKFCDKKLEASKRETTKQKFITISAFETTLKEYVVRKQVILYIIVKENFSFIQS